MDWAGHVSGRPLAGHHSPDGPVVTSNPEPSLTVEDGTSQSAFDMVYRCFERQWWGLPEDTRTALLENEEFSCVGPHLEDQAFLWWTEITYGGNSSLSMILMSIKSNDYDYEVP